MFLLIPLPLLNIYLKIRVTIRVQGLVRAPAQTQFKQWWLYPTMASLKSVNDVKPLLHAVLQLPAAAAGANLRNIGLGLAM